MGHGQHFLYRQEGRNGREEEMEEAAEMEGRRRGQQEGRNGREEKMEEEAEISSCMV